MMSQKCMVRHSLESRLSVPDFVSQLWSIASNPEQIRNREPGFEARLGK